MLEHVHFSDVGVFLVLTIQNFSSLILQREMLSRTGRGEPHGVRGVNPRPALLYLICSDSVPTRTLTWIRGITLKGAFCAEVIRLWSFL